MKEKEENKEVESKKETERGGGRMKRKWRMKSVKKGKRN